jgi:hypothetical protein
MHISAVGEYFLLFCTELVTDTAEATEAALRHESFLDGNH